MGKQALDEMRDGYGRLNPFDGWSPVAMVDESEPYEVDTTEILVMPDGRFALRTAAGCSCWDGEYDVIAYDTLAELLVDIGPSGTSDYRYNPSFAAVADLTRQCIDKGYDVPPMAPVDPSDG